MVQRCVFLGYRGRRAAPWGISCGRGQLQVSGGGVGQGRSDLPMVLAALIIVVIIIYYYYYYCYYCKI